MPAGKNLSRMSHQTVSRKRRVRHLANYVEELGGTESMLKSTAATDLVDWAFDRMADASEAEPFSPRRRKVPA